MPDLGGALEENILTLLCHSDTHAPGLTLQLTARLFSSRSYRKLAETAIDYTTRYGRAAGIHMRDILEDDLRRGDEGKILSRALDSMEALFPKLQADYVLSELQRFISLRKLSEAVDEAADALHAGDLEAAERALSNRVHAQTMTAGIWLHDTDAMLRFFTEREEDQFSSGIEIFDKRGVRPFRKELFLFVGAKGIGKSWCAVQLGKDNLLLRRRVLHITLENSEEVTALRYIQALFAMTKREAEAIRVPIFKKDALGRATSFDFDNRTPMGVMSSGRAAIADKLKRVARRARLLIKEFPTGTLTIAQLNNYLDMLKQTESFVPDLVIVDSCNRMAMRSEHLRTDLGQTVILLRGIAVAREMAVVSFTHTNRSGDLAKLATGAAHIGEDYSMLGTADNIAVISRTGAERQIGLARLLVDKARNEEDKWVAMISQNLPTGQFCLDSVYMNKYMEEEVNRFGGEESDG